MDYDEHIDAIEREAAAVSAALAGGPVDVPVPGCPEWTLADLAVHVGQFCGFWSHVVCEGTGRPKPPLADPKPDEHRPAWFADWFAAAAAALVGALRATGPGTAVWTWNPDDMTSAFLARRAAHEVAVHRFDAQSARAAGRPIDGALAVDGIEEIFAMIAAWRALGQDIGAGAGETIHLHASDPDAEWTLTFGPDGLAVDRRHAKGDLALRGAASDLELVLYKRTPLGPVERFGDPGLLDVWGRAFTFR